MVEDRVRSLRVPCADRRFQSPLNLLASCANVTRERSSVTSNGKRCNGRPSSSIGGEMPSARSASRASAAEMVGSDASETLPRSRDLRPNESPAATSRAACWSNHWRRTRMIEPRIVPEWAE